MTFLRLLQAFFGILFLLAVGNLTRADNYVISVESTESHHYIELNTGFALSEPDLILFDIYTLP